MADTFDDFPITRNFEAIQHGDWFRVTLTYKVSGSPVNLTSYTAEMVIFDDAGNTLATSTSPSGIVLGGAAGTINPRITDVQTAAMPVGIHNYNLWLIDGSGNRLAFSVGKFAVRKGLTA